MKAVHLSKDKNVNQVHIHYENLPYELSMV